MRILNKKYWKKKRQALRKSIMYYFYKRKVGKLVEKAKSHDRIKVVFFVINISMWKLDKLFQLLLDDPRFEPYVVSYLYPTDPEDTHKKLQKAMKEYFDKRGFPFIESHNFDTGSWFDLKAFAPDLIFYAQPYNKGFSRYRLKHFWRSSLLCYIPYCVNLELWPSLYNVLYLNLCWRFYCGTESNKAYVSKLLYNRGEGVTPVGDTIFGEMGLRQDLRWDWKQADTAIKRVIWAPHHSVLSKDTLSCSTFCEIADSMLEMARKHEGKVQFAFKPHPRLKTKLYTIEGWGKEKTDWYYEQWEQLPNTILADGSYIDLFLTSDAMIHDCASFLCEYLYTCKPVMFVARKKGKFFGEFTDLGNSLANECMKLHTIGYTQEDINGFIENVLAGTDPLAEERVAFKSTVLQANKGEDVFERIYEDLKHSLT